MSNRHKTGGDSELMSGAFPSLINRDGNISPIKIIQNKEMITSKQKLVDEMDELEQIGGGATGNDFATQLEEQIEADIHKQQQREKEESNEKEKQNDNQARKSIDVLDDLDDLF